MTLSKDNFNLTIKLDSIFCYQGDDIDDFFDPDSEPYLWTFMIKLDGAGFEQQGNYLVERPGKENEIYYFSDGSQRNIGGPINKGTRKIPDAIGTWRTSLQSIPTYNTLFPAQNLGMVPGIIICIAILMEENATDNKSILKANLAVQQLIKRTMRNIVASMGINGLAADIFTEEEQERRNGTPIAREEAAQRILSRRMKPVMDIFDLAATGAGIKTILNDLDLGDIPPDKFMGLFTKTFTRNELANTYTEARWNPLGEKIRLIGKMWNMPQWAYNIHGTAYAHRKLELAPPPDAPRLQVQCTTKIFRRGEKRISGIGGTFNGEPWVLGRSTAANMIRNGSKSFYVKDVIGRETEVRAYFGWYDMNGKPWYYLQTDADETTSNNLLQLPDCENAVLLKDFWY
ncbi:MAG: DUF3892 domain-containing protein [Dinghuibacter sp.]|nr:DUF3892 domain-containing protein [Dinghuibacter sp.]